MQTKKDRKKDNGSILADLFSGALPLHELPRFALWLIGRTFWGWFSMVMATAVILIIK